jgi:hypothetical protein
VTLEIASTQGIVKQEVKDNAEKMKTPITTQREEGIFTQEAPTKEKVTTTKEMLEKFVATWK